MDVCISVLFMCACMYLYVQACMCVYMFMYVTILQNCNYLAIN